MLPSRPAIAMVAQRDRRRTTTLQAIALHESVSPDRWCVTNADLKYLKQQVICAIQQGLILSASPTSCDSDDSMRSEDDVEFGPSIYVVNEQYIKPITAEAGKMSWALMMNPDGLECDIFVSHAWQEGIFEFLSKVLGSWPSAACNAWCCMLANPQNLNIGSMLQSPKTSPFALALQASRHVLVVPNRHTSVYCRLWCGYEAYVASEKAKIIQIATLLHWELRDLPRPAHKNCSFLVLVSSFVSSNACFPCLPFTKATPSTARSMMISFCLALIPLGLGHLGFEWVVTSQDLVIGRWQRDDSEYWYQSDAICLGTRMRCSDDLCTRSLESYTRVQILSGRYANCQQGSYSHNTRSLSSALPELTVWDVYERETRLPVNMIDFVLDIWTVWTLSEGFRNGKHLTSFASVKTRSWARAAFL